MQFNAAVTFVQHSPQYSQQQYNLFVADDNFACVALDASKVLSINVAESVDSKPAESFLVKTLTQPNVAAYYSQCI